MMTEYLVGQIRQFDKDKLTGKINTGQGNFEEFMASKYNRIPRKVVLSLVNDYKVLLTLKDKIVTDIAIIQEIEE